MIRNLKLMIIFSFILVMLVGCFGGSGNVDTEEREFKESSFIDLEENSELEKILNDLEESNREKLKSIDYVIESVLFKDKERSYIYSVLNKPIDSVLQHQILFGDLHREYMKHLYEKGVSKEDLIFQNRLFKHYLAVYGGKKFNEKRNVKLILERNYSKYNTLEFEAIENGDNLVEFIEEYRVWEESIGLRDWYKKAGNANYEEDLFIKHNLKIRDMGIEEKEGIVQILRHVSEVNEYMDSYHDDNEGEALAKLNAIKNDIDRVILNKNNDWIKERGARLVEHYIGYIKLNKENMFKAADELFFVDLQRMEDLTSLYMVETQMNNNDFHIGSSGDEEEQEVSEGDQ